MSIAMLFTDRMGINCSTVFIICSALYALINKRFYSPRPVVYCLIAYVLTMAISAIYSPDYHEAWIQFRRVVPLITIPLAFCCFQMTRRQWNVIMLIYCRFAFIFVICTLIGCYCTAVSNDIPLSEFLRFSKHHIHYQEPYHIVYSWTPYWHPTYNAWGLVIALIGYMRLLNLRAIKPFELLSYALLLFVVIYITQSRVGVLMWGMALLLCCYAFIRSPKLRIAYWIVLSGTLIAVFVLWLTIPSGFSIDPVRQSLYQKAFSALKEHPVLGVGLGGLPYALDDFMLRNPHNQFVGDWLQSGLLCLTALIVMLGSIVREVMKNRSIFLLAILAVALLIMLMEMPFFLLKGTMLFIVPLAIFIQDTTKDGLITS